MIDDRLIERFWRYVDRRGEDECWSWLGPRQRYGRLTVNGGSEGAHRIAWEIAYGPIPEGLWVLHTCDNPPCVNPAHLYLGTHEDNMRDMVKRGRSAAGIPKDPARVARGERVHTARLCIEQVRAIRMRADAGESLSELGREFGVTEGNIRHIIARRSWAHA